MVGFDDDGDLFVNVNTEDGKAGVNNDDGDPQVWVYLNDATLHDPEEFAWRRPGWRPSRTTRSSFASSAPTPATSSAVVSCRSRSGQV